MRPYGSKAMQKVAVIGAGPAGLAVARWMKREGFEPTIFEQADRLGGQWSSDPKCSGVWQSLHTNTWRDMTVFSDLQHAPTTPLYPSNQTMLAYLTRYAEQFDLISRIRLRTPVRELHRAAGGWRVRSGNTNGSQREEHYPLVVVASGRFTKPVIPDVPGLASFTGRCGVAHTFHCKDFDRYRGRRVLIGGCSVSALEIACELAQSGAARVVNACRRQRYIMQKLISGVPVEHFIQTRAAALAHSALPREVNATELKDFIVTTSGSPEQFGAPMPDPDLLLAGVTHCQSFLPLVAEGRIIVKRWIRWIDGQRVHFADGSNEAFDGLIFGTGFALDLPFLSEELRRTLAVGPGHMDLHKFTFHPDLPGLAFAGLFQVTGPYFLPIELQARWIAYAWSGARRFPSDKEMRAGIVECRSSHEDKVHMPSLTLMFAREAGVEPDLRHWPELERSLLHGPLLPISFRLQGRDQLIDAPTSLSNSIGQGKVSASLRRKLAYSKQAEHSAIG
jgi:dimethylaniline monooxygenase (N-oxide forming)